MSRRHILDRQLALQQDIRSILTSLKSLSHLESQRLNILLPAQVAGLAQVQRMANRYSASWTLPVSDTCSEKSLLIIIGSERGLCGDFNRALVERLNNYTRSSEHQLIVIGTRLSELLERHPTVLARLAGANIAEDVPDVIGNLLKTLNAQADLSQTLPISLLYHDASNEALQLIPLLSPFSSANAHDQPQPLLTNLPPVSLLKTLLQEYLYRVLIHASYSSLLRENQKRTNHLENAVSHLDDQHERLTRQRSRLYQEEIVAELETILLAADTDANPLAWSLDDPQS